MGSNTRRRRTLVHTIIVLAVLFAVAAGAWWYEFTYTLPEGVIEAHFVTPSGVGQSLRLEVVATPQTQEKGLMYRKELPRRTGMLFVFPEEAEHTFWMKNTYITLDMLFLSKEKRVVGILSRVPVLNEEPRTVGKPSTYVLELAGGVSQELQIAEGSELVVERGVLPSSR